MQQAHEITGVVTDDHHLNGSKQLHLCLSSELLEYALRSIGSGTSGFNRCKESQIEGLILPEEDDDIQVLMAFLLNSWLLR